MTPSRYKLIKDALGQALELPNEQSRQAYLAQVGMEDTSLRREVESLLQQEDDPLEDCVEAVRNRHTNEAANRGRRIGAYELVRELGRGGMGSVWLARRADQQFEKLVAIKLLKRGTDTDEVLRRFQAERQILARLEHPNIARLIDAGTTENDLPYFVMEYVEGARVTDHCFTQDLSISERLVLFQKICNAVQFAHQNLVVHRDLKPGNILVATNGEPKLLDFGVAKLLAPDNEAFLATLDQDRRLTPAYASPEQVRGEAITTGSDIYTLGLLLYEILAGKSAHRFSNSRPSPTELFQVVTREEPVRPSAAATDAAIRRRLRGDLDNIILKALRKEPNRRYEGVGGMATDIGRHLQNRPVLARPDTMSYRLRKFAQRNKLGVTAGVLVLLTLIGGIIGTAWEARQANERFNEVRELAHSVLFDYHDAIAALPGSTAVRERLVKDSLKYLDNLGSKGSSDPSLQREIAAAYLKVGDLQGLPYSANLGDTAGALLSYQRARAILKDLKGDDDVRSDLVFANERIAKVKMRSGDWDEALALTTEGVAAAEQLVAKQPKNIKYRERLADCYLTLGKSLYSGPREYSLPDQERAIISYQKALAIHKDLALAEPASVTHQDDAAIDITYIGYAYWKIAKITGDQENNRKALANCREGLAIFNAIAQTEPQNTRWQRHLLSNYTDVARSYLLLGDPAGALKELQNARAICEKLLVADAKNLEVRQDLADIDLFFGNAYEQAGEPTAARHDRAEAASIYEKLLESNPANTEARESLQKVKEGLAKQPVAQP